MAALKVVVIGAGEVGFHIAQILSQEGSDVIIVDKNEERLRFIAENLDVQTILGSGSSPEILRAARTGQADMVVAVTDSDETNMIACLLASTQSRVPIRIARIRNPELSDDSILFDRNHLNIDLRINPEREAVQQVVNLLQYPGAAEIFDFAGGRVKLLGFGVDERCIVAGKKLLELRELNQEAKVLITSIIRRGKLIVPSGSTRVAAGDYLFAVADARHVHHILRFFGKETRLPQRVVIVGGGNTGAMLAKLLEEKGMGTKIIEKRPDRCEVLAALLARSVVLRGDGTSQDLLKEENIADADFLIAVTNDEQANILGALLAKQLGARKVVSLINRIDYMPVVSMVGIDAVINPRHAAISRILHFIRRGKIIAATLLRDERVEAFEFIALETSDITNRPFKEIDFPRGTIVGAMVRGEEVIIPGGDSVILPGDHVIIFTPRTAIPQVEKLLTVKLEYFG